MIPLLRLLQVYVEMATRSEARKDLPYALTVRADRLRRLIKVRIDGMILCEEIERYPHEEAHAISELGDIADGYDLLVELSGYQVQSQAMAEAFRAVVNEKPARANRIAIITPSMLLRMQTRRMIDRDDIKFFKSENDAAGWPDPP